MESFTLTVRGIERNEYYQACREMNRRTYAILAAAMVVICGAIVLATGNVRPAAFFGPAVVYVIAMAAAELMPRLGYKDQLASLDQPVTYEFTADGWSVTAGDTARSFRWCETPRLHETRDCVFIYNDGASGNLLPRRLLTDGQIKAVRERFDASRTEAKAFRREKERREREEFRNSHPGLRLGRTGPLWGPWKRR